VASSPIKHFIFRTAPTTGNNVKTNLLKLYIFFLEYVDLNLYLEKLRSDCRISHTLCLTKNIFHLYIYILPISHVLENAFSLTGIQDLDDSISTSYNIETAL
jgi:hypothetical protein